MKGRGIDLRDSNGHSLPHLSVRPSDLVTTNALGSRNATGRISREQTSERIVAGWGKRPKFVPRLPIQIMNDEGRSHQQSQAPFLRRSTFVRTWFIRAELPTLWIFWRRLWLEKFGRLQCAKLAIASFIA